MKTGEKKINPTTCHNLSLSPRSSWEPAENVVQCDRLLSSFWKHVGLDDRDYSPGDRFDAQPSWISAPMYAPLDRCFANHLVGLQNGNASSLPISGAKLRKRKEPHETNTIHLR